METEKQASDRSRKRERIPSDSVQGSRRLPSGQEDGVIIELAETSQALHPNQLDKDIEGGKLELVNCAAG